MKAQCKPILQTPFQLPEKGTLQIFTMGKRKFFLAHEHRFSQRASQLLICCVRQKSTGRNNSGARALKDKIIVGAVLLVTLAFTSFANAITTYTYTGNNYTVAMAPFTTSMSIDGSFTLADPLGPNMAVTQIAGDVLDFSFNNGVFTFTPGNTPITDFLVGTDSSGNINIWNIQLIDQLTPGGIVGEDVNRLWTSFVFDQGVYIPCQPPVVGGMCLGGGGGFAQAFQTGTWTTATAVPEPHSFVLIGVGLIGLGICGRKYLH
jgi:hypothetical protein